MNADPPLVGGWARDQGMQVTTVDLSSVPEAMEGKWVVFRASDQVAMGHGETALDALANAGVGSDDPNILLVLIPFLNAPMSA